MKTSKFISQNRAALFSIPSLNVCFPNSVKLRLHYMGWREGVCFMLHGETGVKPVCENGEKLNH